MAKKRIVIKNDDGTCGILIPSPNWNGTLEELAEKDVPEGKEWRIVNESDIPLDRTFRNAWTDDNETETIDVDMNKAQEIHMNNIRKVRDEKLKELDIETLKGNDVQDQKQILRDIPQNFDLSGASTPEELKELWPSELGDE